MGFFDTLNSVANSVGNYVGSEAPKKFAVICEKATDAKLLEWWDEKQFDPEVDQRLKDVAEKELRRRHLI